MCNPQRDGFGRVGWYDDVAPKHGDDPVQEIVAVYLLGPRLGLGSGGGGTDDRAASARMRFTLALQHHVTLEFGDGAERGGMP